VKILDVPRSGSYQGVTSSRNRFGQYVRTRAIPVNPSSSYQQNVRARLSQNASAWRALTAVQREGWVALGALMVRTDSLGQSYTLTGFQAYCSVNNNNLAAGNAVVSAAPALNTPDALTTATVTLTAASFSVAYTPTPLAAGQRLFSFVSLQRSSGREYEGDFRLVAVSAAAAASPADLFSAYQARFGTPVAGNKIFWNGCVYEAGFLSVGLLKETVVS
jgi:hypothetical protein